MADGEAVTDATHALVACTPSTRWVCYREKEQERTVIRKIMEMQGFKPMSEAPEEEGTGKAI
jgi:hypothetical protein